MGAQISSLEENAQEANSTRVGWVKTLPERGTTDLLVTCIATLLLCVYSSLHPNLPMQQESQLMRQWRFVRWGLLGVLGPEVIVWTAWRQYVSARALQAEVDKYDYSRLDRASTGSSTKSRTKKSGPIHKWTMTHGFYAGMGGLVVDLEDLKTDDETPFIPGQRYLTLTPRGIQLLAECGLLPDIGAKEISDRSKTDGAGKVLAVLQASWLLVQVINRLFFDLPITLLEINTLGHVGCAFGVYLLWWHKPGRLEHPTILHGDWVRPVAAFMYMSSQLSGQGNNWQTFLRDFGGQPEITRLAYVSTEEPETAPTVPPKERDLTDTGIIEAERSRLFSQPFNECGKGHFVPLPEEALPLQIGNKNKANTNATLTRPCTNHDPEKGPGTKTPPLEDTSSMRSLRWQLASTAIHLHPPIRARMIPPADPATKRYRDALRLYPEIPARFKRRLEPLPSDPAQQATATTAYLECQTEELVVTHAGNWPSDELLRGVNGVFMGMTLWFTSILYGAVHLSVWHNDAAFPTRLEASLWRISSVYIAGSGLLWMGINLLAHVSEIAWWFWYDVLAGQVARWTKVGVVSAAGAGSLLYLCARLFIVVEAFVSLRSQPKGAYQETDWGGLFPHL